jgi:serine protease Do
MRLIIQQYVVVSNRNILIHQVAPELLAQSFNLDKPRGALVGQVLPDSPTQAADI